MKAVLPLALLTLAALPGCASAPAPPAAASVTGTVVWRERILLPPTTRVIVRLQDVSLADAPAKVLAEDVLEGVHAPPAAFKLAYDPKAIVPNHRYSVSARVEVEGQLRFINDTHIAVINDGPVSGVEVLVKGVGR
ncbi:YbaY family lipoprotein [Caulobacter hibisci]|uniref:YbaY family lipoprotein n=1 Tax=Caulobacter hibisci TaxID=2035993 RepID=A0ABS0T0Y1_9CAUL|nr:YbaY family lipoprotein [Caulobacter hibisci]MBI1685523.1 YbaY family lipoprotein [Caulobacter hibisci]